MTQDLSRSLTVVADEASSLEAILFDPRQPAHVSTFWSLEDAYPQERLRYHLGQVCMVKLMNSLAEAGNVVKAVICDPDTLTRPVGRFEKARADLSCTSRFIELVADKSIGVERMSELIAQKVKAPSPLFRRLRGEASRAVMELRDVIGQVNLSRKAEEALAAYRHHQPDFRPPTELRPLTAQLQRAFPDLDGRLLLAAAFAFFYRPSWFSAPWLVDFTAYLAEGGNQGPRPVLLEADRNAYAWLLLRCLFEISRSHLSEASPSWPHLVLLRSVPSLTGEGAMQLTNRAGALFLDASSNEIEHRLRSAPARVRRELNLLFLEDQRSVDIASEDWLELFTSQFLKWREKAGELLLHEWEREEEHRELDPDQRRHLDEERFDVFLCHNSGDKPEVLKVAERLKVRGVRPWLDVWELRPGLPWRPTLEAQIEQIGAAAVFIGPSGVGPWQDREIDALLSEFVRRNCPVIPVILPQCNEPPALPLFLKAHTWVDFRRADPDPLGQLLWGITGERG